MGESRMKKAKSKLGQNAPLTRVNDSKWAKIEDALKRGKVQYADDLLNEMLDIQPTKVDPEADEAWELEQRNKA